MLHTRLPVSALAFAALLGSQIAFAQTPPAAPPATAPSAPPAPPPVYVPTSLATEPGLRRTPDGHPDLQGAVWAANFFPVFESTPMSAALTVSESEAKKMVEMMLAGFTKSVGNAFELDPEAEGLIK